MSLGKRYRFPKITVLVFTFICILLILLTWLFFYNGSQRECAMQLLTAQAFGLFLQFILNYVNYRSEHKIVVLATLFVSSTLLLGAISAFFTFHIICSIY